MASVWCSMAHDRADTKVVGHLSPETAAGAMKRLTDQWAASGPMRSLQAFGSAEIHLIFGSALVPKPHVAGHVWVETRSPPSEPTGGDIYRSKTKGA